MEFIKLALILLDENSLRHILVRQVRAIVALDGKGDLLPKDLVLSRTVNTDTTGTSSSSLYLSFHCHNLHQSWVFCATRM